MDERQAVVLPDFQLSKGDVSGADFGQWPDDRKRKPPKLSIPDLRGTTERKHGAVSG